MRADTRGVWNGNSRLSEQDVWDMRAEHALCRVTQATLALRYDVCQKVVSDIVLRKRWRHLLPALLLLIACGGQSFGPECDAGPGVPAPNDNAASETDAHGGWCCLMPDGSARCGIQTLVGLDYITCGCPGVVRENVCLDTAEQ